MQTKGSGSGAEPRRWLVAQAVSLSPSACPRRLRALEEAGLIGGYRAELSRERLGLEHRLATLPSVKTKVSAVAAILVPAGTFEQITQRLAGSSSPDPAALQVMIDEFSLFHVAMAVIASIVAAGFVAAGHAAGPRCVLRRRLVSRRPHSAPVKPLPDRLSVT